MRLGFVAEEFDELLSRAVKQKLSPIALLDELLHWELERQNERRVTQALRIAYLPTGQTLSNFDFVFQPSVQRSQHRAKPPESKR